MRALTLLLLSTTLAAQAELRLPAIIGDNMVLQQKQVNPIWGWDTPGTEIQVALGSSHRLLRKISSRSALISVRDFVPAGDS